LTAASLRLHEHESREFTLAPAELAFIRRELAHALDAGATERAGRYVLRAGSVAGCVALPGGRTLVIEPKLPVDTLFALLAAVYDPAREIFRDEPQSYHTIAALFEFVVAIWAAQAEELLARGVLRGYRPLEAELPVVRGRLLVLESERRGAGLRERVWCADRARSADVAENRVLRWTAHALAGYRYREARLAARLTRVAGALGAAGVALDAGAAALPAHVDYHRLNDAYRPALALARLLLDGLAPSGTPGDEPFLAYLVDMDWLFERYVGMVLRAAAPAHGLLAREQERHPLDVAQQVSVRPDVVLYRQGRPALVVDAKYKRAAAGADLYQVVAYCHALGLAHAALVYPAGEAPPAREVTVRGAGAVRVRYLALDLRGGPEELARAGRRMADEALREV
jgi:5-methylcytosine-specific restriction enzyme subunit McrC